MNMTKTRKIEAPEGFGGAQEHGGALPPGVKAMSHLWKP